MQVAVRSLLVVLLVGACAVAPALGASKPKRGVYIDPALGTQISTTKDVSAIKSFQTGCMRPGLNGAAPTQNGSFIVSRKLRINSKGGFAYSGNAKIYTGNPKPAIAKVTITARYSGGRYKGTAKFPAAYGCLTSQFSAKYYGVNPKG